MAVPSRFPRTLARAATCVIACVCVLAGSTSVSGGSPRIGVTEGVDALQSSGLDLVNPPTRPSADFGALVAYSFGYRVENDDDPARGIVTPGPVNEALAEAVVRVRGDRQIPVYAQFEIAEVLASVHGLTDVTPIYPIKNPDGTVTYLSTDGVAGQVSRSQGATTRDGLVGVIAFRDHLWRSTYTSRVNGLRAYAPGDVPMPSTYDPQSGQEWTRSRDAYLPRDYAARLSLIPLLNGDNADIVFAR